MASQLAVLGGDDLLLDVRRFVVGVNLILQVEVFAEVDSEVVPMEAELVFAQWRKNVEVRAVHVEVCREELVFQLW